MKKLFTIIFLLHTVITNGQSFAKAMGGTGADVGRSVTVDAAGNTYTSGYFTGTADFNPGVGTFNLTSKGNSDIFVSKLDAAGNFVWAKSLGGGGIDGSIAITLDASGNVYTAGYYTGTADFDPGPGTFNISSAGGSQDIFISKLDAAGNFVWAKSMGSITSDLANKIMIDASGNIYTTGYYGGTADFDPGPGTFNISSAGGSQDIFISKLDAAGNFVWAKSMGGVNTDLANKIMLDASGNIYTAGYYTGTADFDPGPGIFNISSSGGSGDVFISKLDAAGNFVWAKAMGGAGIDVGIGISVDAAGNIYTAGYFNGSADFDPSPAAAFNLISAGSIDIFISKLDAAGNFVWAKKMGGTVNDAATGISVDASGNVYTTGNYTGTADFDPGAGTFNISGTGGSQDIFISKLDAAGNFVWAKSMGSLVADAGNEIFVDVSGNVYTTGIFSSIADFDPGAATFNLTSAGNSDIFVSKLDASGQLIMPATGLNFDGLNDYVQGTNTALPQGNSPRTVEAWFKTSSATTQTIVNYGGVAGQRFGISILSSVINIADGSFDYSVGSPAVIDNLWHHVAAVFNGNNTLKVYVDGILVGSNPRSYNTTGSSFSIGNKLGVGEFFNGSIDEVRIWNRALCQSEIVNNMNAQLIAAQQTGLKGYYPFNQGVVNGNNTAITIAADSSGNNVNGTLYNFALAAGSSNWTAGNVTGYGAMFVPASLAGVTGGAQVCQLATVQAPGTNYLDASCNLIAAVNPSGVSPVAGTVNTCVKIDATVQTYNGQPYVQRHYDIEPSTNASTATGTVTLYYTQAEFDAYNLVRGANPALPASGGDAAGIASIILVQYHGTGTTPGTYTGGAVTINPADNNIIWNSTLARWEITFTVTGFSGFYLTTSSSILPLHLINFTGSKQAAGNLLQWQTANEINTKGFIIEKSTDSRNFSNIGSVAAKGMAGNTYSFTDSNPFTDNNYYRLKMTDNDGKFTYSNIIRLTNQALKQVAIYPNPAENITTIQITDKKLFGTTAKIIDAAGKTVQTFIISGNFETADISRLSSGLYFLQTADGGMQKIIRK